MGTQARVLADSVGPHGCRLTTFELRFPRCILSQARTYGMHSWSVRSSRAVPTRVMLDEVRTDPFVPAVWRRAGKGMVAGDELPANAAADCRLEWLEARDAAADHAEALAKIGTAKEHVNRLLEPWAWSWAVVTATEWDWFFAQRLADDAQPEFRELAQTMKAAMDASESKRMREGQWHLPYVLDSDASYRLHSVSAARCARVSYRTFDAAAADPDKDVELADRLLADGHLSPFEHSAMCCVTRAPRAKLHGWMSYRTWLGY